MSLPLIPVVLCGGSGSRLWPLSRKLLPKQFLPLASERTMLQDTVARLAWLPECEAPILVCSQEHRFLAAEQLREIGVRARAILLEPVARNTAPAIAAAALAAAGERADALILVLASDHVVQDEAAFRDAVRSAARAAQAGHLVTFGIRPTAPATGYGYIEAGEPIAGGVPARRIRRFVEKPDLATAQSFLARGGHLWNSGMFVFGARRYLEELGRQRPAILAAVRQALAESVRDLDFTRLGEVAFAACPAESADYAVMEQTALGAVVEGTFRWSDVGSWSSLWDISGKDADGNVARGDVTLTDTRGSYVRADERHVSVLGARDLVVVETDDAVLVAARERAQDVKEVVEHLARQNRTEHISHTRVYRPWGYYEAVDAGARFQVKRLMVKPGQSLSLQLHRRRTEHWVVVSGTARVTRGEEVLTLAENQSTFIPIGIKHRLENAGTAPLFLIEVQSGDYLGEDDIERFEDRYGRA